MSFGGGGSSGTSSSQSSSESKPLTPEEVQGYFDQLDGITGGKLGNFAQNGSQQVNYNGLSTEQLQAIGGAGATRKQAVSDGLTEQLGQINDDSSLTYAQRQRLTQLANDSATQNMDAINKEVEASLAALAQAENQNQYNADIFNSQLKAKDLELLANIFFSGKGQVSSSQSSSTSSNSSSNANAGLW